MGLYDDPSTLDPGTSFVPEEDPFLTWYHGAPPATPNVPVPSAAAPAADPSEIQMPPVDARPVKLGMPHDPGVGLEQEAGLAPMPEPILPEQLTDDPFHPVEHVPAVDVGPPQVDAISGGDVTPLAKTSDPLSATPGSELVDPNAPEMHGEELTPEQRAQAFRRMSPDEQARTIQSWNEQRDARERDLRDRADLEQQQREVENHSAIQRSITDARAATEKLNADAAKQANEELDTSWHASTGKRIAGIILGIVGGLVQSRQGGANQGLAIIDQDLANQIEARKLKAANQRAELARRGASIQQQLAFDMQTHEENVRFGLATYERAKSAIQSEMGKYDPKGKTALQLGQTYAAIDQARAKALADYESTYQKNWVEMYKLDQEDRKIAVTQGELALKQAKAAGAGGSGTPAFDPAMEVQPPEAFVALGLPRPPGPMSRHAYKNWLELKKAGNEATTGEASLSKEELEHGVGDLKTEDGKPFLAQGSPEAVGKLRDQVAAARNMVRLMDEVRAIRTGWTSDTAKSKEWQEIKSNWAALKGEAKNLLQLGALSESDYDLVDAFIGSPDPTKWQGRLEGIAKARENIINKTRTALNASAARGKAKFDIPYITPAAPKATVADQAQKDALHAPSGQDVFDAGMPTPIKDPLEIAHEIENGKPAEAPAAEDSLREVGLMGDVPANDKAHIDTLAAQLDDPKERETAGKMLNALAGAGKTPTANYARQVMQQHLMSARDAAAELSGPVTSTAYEEAPPRPAKEPNKKRGGR